MKKYSLVLIIILFFISCKNDKVKIVAKETDTTYEVFKTDDYELIKPNEKSNTVLVLFGGYPENIEDIKREFKIIDIAKENNVAVLFMNFNKKLWLEEGEKVKLTELLYNTITKNTLQTDNIFIGGFSSGGVVSLLISDFIIEMNQYAIEPKGVFIIDSPIDLLGLYHASKKNIKKNFSEISVEESTWIIKALEEQFGKPEDSISEFEKYSVYTLKTHNIKNLVHLKNTKIRLYTEPDTIWWKQNRLTEYENTNAYYIKSLSEDLKKEFGDSNIEYIPTLNRGYRSNGDRHPHSWSIVDEKDLMNWMLNEK